MDFSRMKPFFVCVCVCEKILNAVRCLSDIDIAILNISHIDIRGFDERDKKIQIQIVSIS